MDWFLRIVSLCLLPVMLGWGYLLFLNVRDGATSVGMTPENVDRRENPLGFWLAILVQGGVALVASMMFIYGIIFG